MRLPTLWHAGPPVLAAVPLTMCQWMGLFGMVDEKDCKGAQDYHNHVNPKRSNEHTLITMFVLAVRYVSR
eukprot:11204213-Lingulodinium_polyedra.AAC.1